MNNVAQVNDAAKTNMACIMSKIDDLQSKPNS